MGNCVFKGFGLGVFEEEMIKVVTSNGGIMELYPPITAESITNEFPGYSLFRSSRDRDRALLDNQDLIPGELYYLLPPTTTTTTSTCRSNNTRSSTITTTTSNSSSSSSNIFAPYRMSLDNQSIVKRSEPEVFPRYNSSGVWKVKLVISPQQLSDILSQDARTEALIESVRTVAKCGGVSNNNNNNNSSDQCSISGNSCKAPQVM